MKKSMKKNLCLRSTRVLSQTMMMMLMMMMKLTKHPHEIRLSLSLCIHHIEFPANSMPIVLPYGQSFPL